MVVADLEAAFELRGRADPLAVGQDHVHVTGPFVEFADQGPHFSGGDGDLLVVGVIDDLVETGRDLDVGGVVGQGIESNAEFDEGATDILSPISVLTELEAAVAAVVLGDVGEVAGPHAVLLGHGDIAAPTVEVADDSPALVAFRLGFGLVAADLGAHAAAEGLDHGREAVRIEDEVIDAVLGNLDVCAVLRDREFGAEAAELAAHVDGPGLVLTELEFVGSGELDALGHVGLAVGDHREVAVPFDAVVGQVADDAPVAGILMVRIREVRVGDGNGVGAQVEPEVIGAVRADLDVRTVLGDGKFGIESGELTAHIDIPALVLAELELVVLGEADGLGHDVVAVFGGPGLEVAVPIDVIVGQGTDDAPRGGLGVVGVRAALRQGDGEGRNRIDLGIHEAVAAVVLGRILDGGADHDVEVADLLSVGVAEELQRLADIDVGRHEAGAAVLGGDGLADGLAVHGDQRDGMGRRNLVVEAHFEHGGRVRHGDVLGTNLDRTQDRSGGVRRIEHDQLLLEAGDGHQAEKPCGKKG